MPEGILNVSAAHRDRAIGKCLSERFGLLEFHKGSASTWQLRNREYNCSKCISFLAMKLALHVHLGDRKRKPESLGAGRREIGQKKRNYTALSPAILYPFHILSISVFPSTPRIEGTFLGTSDVFLSPSCVILLGSHSGKERKKTN